MRVSTRVISLFTLLAALTVEAAQDRRGSADHPLLERYPRAWIVNYVAESSPDFRWALGALEKVDGVVTAEAEQRLKGDLVRISYRLPAGVTPNEAYQHIRDQLATKGAVQKFACEGRACGSSNQWANRVFGYSKLYGVERSQLYSAWQLGNTAVALYAVQRGNKRVYLHLDLLELEAVDMVASLKQQGYVRWAPNGDLSTLVGYLNSSNSTFWLVGHQQQSGAADVLQSSSQLLAQKVADELVSAGVQKDSIRVFGLGALAPGLVEWGEEAVFLIQRR